MIGNLSELYASLCILTVNLQIFSSLWLVFLPTKYQIVSIISVVCLVIEHMSLHGLPCLVVLKLHTLQMSVVLPFIHQVVDYSSSNRNTRNKNVSNLQAVKLLIVSHSFRLTDRRLLVSFCLPLVTSE